jgi:hypothetical protein
VDKKPLDDSEAQARKLFNRVCAVTGSDMKWDDVEAGWPSETDAFRSMVAELRAEVAESIAREIEATAAKMYDHARGPLHDCAAIARRHGGANE